MFCKHCGQQTFDNADVCESCALAINSAEDAKVLLDFEETSMSENETKEPSSKKDTTWSKIPKPLIVAVAVAIMIALAAIIGFFVTRCDHAGCNNYASYGDYCEEHVCAMYPSCTSERAYDSAYCYYHKGLLEEITSKSKNISVGDVRVKREKYSSYVTATGTVKNNGSITFDFVRVRAAFKDSKGNVVDTDWTYAVGSEGLEPGESTTFELYVKDNGAISTVDVTVVDD